MIVEKSFMGGFSDELEKLGFIGKAVKKLKPFLVSHWPGMVGAGFGAVAVRDISKGLGAPELKTGDIIGRKEERVSAAPTVTEMVKKHKFTRPVVAVTDRHSARKMIDEIEEEDPTTKKWNDEERVGAMRDILSIIGKGQNAAMIMGDLKKKIYIVTPKKVNRIVLEHEVGHAKDLDRKDVKEPGILRHMTSLVWYPSYRKTTMEPEERAWEHAELKTKREKGFKEKALGTYRAGFHMGRGTLAGAGGMLAAGLGYGLNPMIMKALRRGKG